MCDSAHLILVVLVVVVVPGRRRAIVGAELAVILKLRSRGNQRRARHHSDLPANPIIEPGPLAAKLTGSKENRHAANAGKETKRMRVSYVHRGKRRD